MSFLQHPLSAAFPPMSAEDFQALKDSIDHIGVQNPITLLDGMVLDGWNRYSAALQLGMDCPTVELGDVDPKDFVLAQNRARRHITQAQLIACASAVWQWRPNGGDHSALSADCISSKDFAEKVGSGIRSVEQYRQIEQKAAPEVIAAVKRGDLGLPKAAAIAKLPQAEQAAAINKPLPKPAPKPAPEPDKVEPEAEAPPEYTELDAAHDLISGLQADLVVARMGDIPEDQKTQAAERIADLQAELNTAHATIRALTISRDTYMTENAQMKRQMAAQRAEIARLKSNK